MDDSPSPSFLDLPAHYNLEVHDILHFNSCESSTSKYALNDYTTGAGTVLVSKAIDALRDWTTWDGKNYSDADIAKVGGLVERYLFTVHSAQVVDEVEKRMKKSTDGEVAGDEEIVSVPDLTVELMLKGLLDTAVTKDAVVNINSNEPVLLINFDVPKSARMDAKQRDVRDRVINTILWELRRKWNVMPVRVFARTFLGESTLSNSEKRGENVMDPAFSITLLNVVNTDIGGPSMPQLLDAHCDAPEWDAFIKREVWHGTDLVSAEYGSQGIAALADNASEHTIKSAGDGDDDSVGSAAHIYPGSPDRQPGWKERSPVGSDIYEQDNQVLADAGETRVVPPEQEGHAAGELGDEESHKQDLVEEGADEEPASDPVLPARDVEHPTWNRHEDGMSLLDLIKSQASTMLPFGAEAAGHGVADVEGNMAGSMEATGESSDEPEKAQASVAETKRTKTKAAAEDEFVVV